ncbi:MAG: ABC transporter substrate-binding protein [Campylobacteraceae bacterium]|nr:ABC transporter substrate-binding protein [Campylobacteraceae bacterium]
MKFIFIIMLSTLIINAQTLEKLRIGVLSYGTVNWELKIMQINKIAQKNGIDLEVVKLASKNAVSIALQAKAVDVIVSDYIWVSRQRASGYDYTFYPYSKATGGVYVNASLNAKTLEDLESKSLGIAGGPVSKTWLITRAYTKFKYKKDFSSAVKKTFASPPILYKKVLDGSIDASINFWHYNAKLEAQGVKKLISAKQMLNEMGVKNDTVLLGWVFSTKFAEKNKKLINNFLQSSYESKKLLNSSPTQWNNIRKSMKAKSNKVFAALVKGYKEGIPKQFGEKEIQAAKKTFDILYKEGGSKLTGKSKVLQDGTFWEFTPNIIW